ncbi:MAG: hypothetical protein A3I75_00375 [Deltaproteobacteria bacterium RIFCSPLOWO2_02_FULL_50_16]|nr:MAG: hypothetical protein A3I75_00375 [Deltaproteobacteria bacterium RIFCSPLOWO2_02_FULL_50_16]OGQ67974.1 MAG: hypothetical protein A3F89_03605 [Deltaproteobacteria bacterium RIFCSPLOWO2_12_FULL_50_11]
MGSTTLPPPPDNNPGMIATAMASADKTMTQAFAGVTIAQTMAGVQIHQANNQLMLGLEMLDTKETIALSAIEADLEKAELKNDADMKSLRNERAEIRNERFAIQKDPQGYFGGGFGGGSGGGEDIFG